MVNEYLKLMEYEIRTKLNQLDYFLHKLPIIRKKPLFQFRWLKSVFIALAPLYNLLAGFTSTAFTSVYFVGIMYFIHKLFDKISLPDLNEGTFFAFIFTSLVIHSTFSLWGEGDQLRLFYNFFHMDPLRLYRMKLFFKGSFDLIPMLLVYSIVAKILGFPFYYGFVVIVLLHFWTFFTEALHLYTYKHRMRDIKSNKWIGIFIGGFVLAIAVSLFVPFSLKSFLFHPLQVLVVLGGIWGMVYVYRYEEISKLLFELPVLESESKDGESMSKQIALEAAKLEDKDLEAGQRHLKKGLKGYKLLNELFFQRHRRIILKPIIVKSGILLAIGLVVFLLPKMFPQQLAELLKDPSALEGVIFLLPVMGYVAFNQDTLTRTMFINCDQALMQYGFYRRPQDLLEMFGLRLKKLLTWSSLALLAMELVLFLNLWTLGILGRENLPVFLMPLSLWFLFSVHSLFVYYYFQPYNSNFEVKSPATHIINIVIYVLCFNTHQLELTSLQLVILFLVVAILYTGIGLLLVYKFAPKRFVLKG